jgi:hypothetical protein
VIILWTGWLSLATAGPQLDVLDHDRAVVGQDIRLRIRVSNPEAAPIQFPDINNRPWLVHFETIDPAGVRRKLFSTPPAEDPPLYWTLSTGERREALFSIPTSASWGPGQATITVTVQDTAISTSTVTLFQPKPDHVDGLGMPIDQSGGTPTHLLTLHQADTSEIWFKKGDRTHYLATTEGRVQPELSVARSDRPIGRWISWSGPDDRLWALRTHDMGAQAQPSEIRLPWPSAVRCGRPATDARARLVQPVCIPSPDGKSTRLVAAIVSNSGAMHTRSIARFRPTQLLTNVNSAGRVDFVLVRPGAVDLASVDTDPDNRRPASIRKLWRARPGQAARSAKLVMSTATPAGPAVALTLEDATETLILSLDQEQPLP